MLRALFPSALMLAAAVSSATAQQRSVNVYNWSDYIEPSVIEAFTKETGIKVKSVSYTHLTLPTIYSV